MRIDFHTLQEAFATGLLYRDQAARLWRYLAALVERRRGAVGEATAAEPQP